MSNPVTHSTENAQSQAISPKPVRLLDAASHPPSGAMDHVSPNPRCAKIVTRFKYG